LDVKDIPQVGPLQWGRINVPCNLAFASDAPRSQVQPSSGQIVFPGTPVSPQPNCAPAASAQSRRAKLRLAPVKSTFRKSEPINTAPLRSRPLSESVVSRLSTSSTSFL